MQKYGICFYSQMSHGLQNQEGVPYVGAPEPDSDQMADAWPEFHALTATMTLSAEDPIRCAEEVAHFTHSKELAPPWFADYRVTVSGHCLESGRPVGLRVGDVLAIGDHETLKLYGLRTYGWGAVGGPSDVAQTSSVFSHHAQELAMEGARGRMEHHWRARQMLDSDITMDTGMNHLLAGVNQFAAGWMVKYGAPIGVAAGTGGNPQRFAMLLRAISELAASGALTQLDASMVQEELRYVAQRARVESEYDKPRPMLPERD